jgi:NAD(P)H-flavin reductase
MPTRGQALYIAYLVLTQIFLAVFPMVFLFPNSIAPTRREHFIVLIGNRTGVLAMADFVALFLFSSRNNILLWITNWSHSTFLLLHRWIGYCLIFQASIHSAIYLANYYADHATESQQPYWIWGVVATLALVVLWPASILPVRQKAYEFFLLSHQVLAALALIATFMHIYKLFTYNWGYEIWVYIGGAIWFLDRFLRVLRMVATGYRTAVVTAVDPDSEYLKIEIDGVVAHGHVYLYFPTLTWRVWENHPYSVLSTFTGATHSSKAAAIEGHGDPEKTSSSGSSSELSSSTSVPGRPKVTILLRPMNGLTRVLATRLGQQKLLSIPVIVEGSYHANPAIRSLGSCSTLLCIGGGVGITPLIPIIRSFEGVKARLAWGVRTEWLLRSVDDEIKDLVQRGVKVDTRISGDANGRLNVGDIVREELLHSEDEGDLGIVVCGPTGMADEVRMVIAELGPKAKRGVVFVDEAFSW